MPIGPFPDFSACVAHMMKPKEEGGGGYDEETAKKVCGKMKAELEESFSWASDLEVLKPYRQLIRGKAIHPIKTYHPYEWPQLRVYLEEELKKSAETLIGKPLFLDHARPLNGSVLGAHYEDGALEYIARLEDEDVLRMIRDGQIKHASVQFEWKSLENVNGVAPHGITFEHLSLLHSMEPGDPASSVEIWESIIKGLKEAKGLAPPNPGKGSETEDKEESKLNEQIAEPSFEDRVKNLEQSVNNIYSRIAELEGVLTAKIEKLLTLVPHVESTREAEWETEYINNLDDDCFAYIEPGGEKDERGKTTPRGFRHFPYKDAQGNLSPDHVRNGLARLGQELGDWATADAKAQIKKKLCAVAEEIEIESTVCDLEESKETIEALKAQIEVLTEQKKEFQEELKRVKKPSEAIISSNVTSPRDMISKKAIEAVLPPDWIARAWGLGPQRFVQDIKRVLRQGREA